MNDTAQGYTPEEHVSLLAWQVAMGVDECTDAEPVNRFDVSASTQQATSSTSDQRPGSLQTQKPAHKRAQEPKSLHDAIPQQDFRHRPQPVAARPARAATGAGPAAAEQVASQCNSIDELRAAVEAFDGGHFKRTATHSVFAGGTPGAPLMIMGETPGAEEDGAGEPFVGPSGVLLDKILGFTGMQRDTNVYLSNIVPWRQLGSRKPGKEILATCLPFARRHIELAAPKVLLMLGATSAQGLLATDKGITQLRGRWHDLTLGDHSLAALATYHPAYLIKTPSHKGVAWRDILLIKERLGSLDV